VSKVVVITGASRGVGAGLAEDFLGRGAKLGLCARSEVPLQDPSVVRARVDVRDPAALLAFAAEVHEAHGPIDLWINNAGVLDPVSFARDLSPQALRDHLDINLIGPLNGAQAFLGHRAAEAVLLNVSSGAALKGYAGWSAYCAGKAALDRLSECLSAEESANGLRVHSVAPGVIDTDMQRKLRGLSVEQFPDLENFLQLKRDEAFNSTAWVAEHLWAIAFDPAARPEAVVARIPNEKE
jgi:benzil reductase ((S)-benzoin forming)